MLISVAFLGTICAGIMFGVGAWHDHLGVLTFVVLIAVIQYSPAAAGAGLVSFSVPVAGFSTVAVSDRITPRLVGMTPGHSVTRLAASSPVLGMCCGGILWSAGSV